MLRSIRIGAFVVAAATLGLATSAYAQKEMSKACKGDGARLCPGMKPGGDDYVQCIKDNKEQLSQQCKDAAAQMKSNMKQQQEPEQGAEPGQTQPK
jgi:arylformamidase